MATELREHEGRTDERAARSGRGPVFWPFIAAALTVLVLAGAALMVVTQGGSGSTGGEISYETDGLTGLREAGPYVEVVAPVAPIGDPMTGTREGGDYAPNVAGHHPPPPDPMTAQREG